jgi:asparagine synthase (glutamine-hydrolysing)
VAQARAWRPAILPSGAICAFHGYFDNFDAIAAELGAASRSTAHVYALAVERWGEEADRRIVGEYSALVASPAEHRLRLSRSPLRAPPLLYHAGHQLAAAASVPRALFAAGVPMHINETRVADSAVFNFHDDEASWFMDIARVPLGSVVILERGGVEKQLHRWFDFASIPDVRMERDEDYIAKAEELLDQGVRACLAGFERPAATLSGGLDSPQVVVRTLKALPADRKLPTFTFHPEDGYDGRVDAGMIGDERPFVEAMAAMHPRLEPHFTANEGYGHDHRWNDFFHLMGAAPTHLPNMYVYHGLFAGAAKLRCDVLLLADWGNNTFSDKGTSAFVEYLLKGQWRQLWLALRHAPRDDHPVWRRFLTLSLLPLLPDTAWRNVRRWFLPGKKLLQDKLQPLSDGYREASGAQRRLRQSGFLPDRYQPRSRRHSRELLFRNEDPEVGEMYQAFEQMYGVAQRDPTAYRPFVEFCLGLPVHLFMRDGRSRWLARELSKGIMPEAQRQNRRVGRWGADWHARIGRRRQEIMAELDELQADPKLGAMLDIPRLRSALENWPEHTETDPQKYFTAEMAVPRGLLTARFIKYFERRND